MGRVAVGSRVAVHFTARFADGSEFATSRDGAPLEFTAGGTEVIPGMSRSVIGMESGETKVFTVRPEDGFGEHDKQLERRVPAVDLPQGVRVGDRFDASADGREIMVYVRELQGDVAVLDANHPLAGHTLIFEIELVSIQS
ncbi:MAG: FKBP-type peptidyl-prolyl cis-trans isomerase [Planctomycetes bacterium]|nr:FKBP-type peptidyl-prolyl cis-trans isomerase [Planctomycetota bacterium]